MDLRDLRHELLRPILVGGESYYRANDGELRRSAMPALLNDGQWSHVDEVTNEQFWRRCMAVKWLLDRGLHYSASGASEETHPPMPIIHSDWTDVELCESSARRVGEAVDRMLFYGWKQSLYGLCNHPSTAVIEWAGAEFTPKLILDAKQILIDKNRHGPYVVFYGPGLNSLFDIDLGHRADMTVRDRIRQLGGIADVLSSLCLKPFDAVLVQATSDAVRMLVERKPTVVQWPKLTEGQPIFSSGGVPSDYGFKTFCTMAPHVMADSAVRFRASRLSEEHSIQEPFWRDRPSML